MAQSLPEEPHFKYYETKSPEKKTLTNKEKLIAAMSGLVLLLVVGGGLAINKYSHKNQPVETEVPTTPAETPQVTIETTPAAAEKPTEVAAEILPTVESLEVSASLISNPEELVKTFEADRITAWMNAGATPENAKKWLEKSNGALGDEFLNQVASEYDQLFIDALYVKGWQSNPNLAANVDRMKLIHKNTLAFYFATSFPNINPQDEEPFKRGAEVTKVYSNNPITIDGIKRITITTIQHDYDNAMKNRIGKENGQAVTGQDNQPTMSYAIEGDKIKYLNIIY